LGQSAPIDDLDEELLSPGCYLNARESLDMRTIALWPTLIVLAIATFTDLRTRRIPNLLVIPFMLAGIVASGWLAGWHGIGLSLAGLALGGLLFGVLSWMGGMGMGDVKLCAAIGAWIGPSQLITALVMTGIAGGIMALCWAFCGGFLGDLFRGSGDLIVGLRRRGLRPDPDLTLDNPLTRKMPYAPAIAIGTLMSFFSR
jgi:prepilin peptidase CpaA